MKEHSDVVGGLSGGTMSFSSKDGQKNPFDSDYFLRGRESGISNYENYRYLPELTRKYAENLAKHLGIKPMESVHDIGCARGFLVKELNDAGFPASGHDISEWAIANCHPEARSFVSLSCRYLPNSVDWVHGKDCLEHWDQPTLEETLPSIFLMARSGCFFIVPLTSYWGGKYIYPADNEDKTHRIRMPLDGWIRMMMDAANQTEGNFSIHGSYHMHGLKKASEDHHYSTGFLTVRRFTP